MKRPSPMFTLSLIVIALSLAAFMLLAVKTHADEPLYVYSEYSLAPVFIIDQFSDGARAEVKLVSVGTIRRGAPCQPGIVLHFSTGVDFYAVDERDVELHQRIGMEQLIAACRPKVI